MAIKSITKPENAVSQPENPVDNVVKEEVFKARAMQPVQDWSDNSGIPYIADINPYAAVGMGFANQMANPFKQKYFENKARANSEEEARRLNYEYERQKKQDDAAEQQRQINNLMSIEAEDVNVPFMSDIENFASPQETAQYKWAREVLNKPFDMNINSAKDALAFKNEQRLRNQARAIINAFNVKYAGMGDKISTRKINDPTRDLTEEAYSKGMAGFKARQDALSEGERDLNDMQNILDDGVMLGKFGVSLNKLTSFGKKANDKARVVGYMNKLRNQYENTGYKGHVVSRENLQFSPTSDPQIATRQMQIKRLLDANQAYVVQMVSPDRTDIVTYLVTPSGKHDISNAFVTTAQMANQDAAMNRSADIRAILRGDNG